MGYKIDLSAVVTAHDEGLLVHKTMRSVFEALDEVERAGFKYEIIVHIDNGDEATIKYFERYKDNNKVRIFKNSFGDTGPSRNYSLNQARGKYVAFLDGDDLVSKNWYVEGIKLLKKSESEIIVHPEAMLTFGIEQVNVLTLQSDSLEREQDAIIMLGANKWSSALMAKTETLKAFPYRKIGCGYGHEDYILNIEAIERGVKHRVAKGTTFFYRRSNNSRLSLGQQNNLIIPYMELFDFEKIKKVKDEVKVDTKIKLKHRAYRVYKKLRNNKKMSFIIPIARTALKITKKRRDGHRVPKFVVEAWKDINRIDYQLYPYRHILDAVQIYKPEEYINVGQAYLKIAQDVSGQTDYVFIVPWVVRGGADKVLLNYIKSLKEIHEDWHFTVIATLSSDNAWKEKLPEYVDFIDFGNVASEMTPEASDILFSRIITQLQCKRLHIINSEYGYNWARRHKELINDNYELNVSLFCSEFIPGSELKGVFSYSDPYLFEVYGVVNKILTDNKTMIGKTVEHNGFDDKKFRVHYQPIEQGIKEPKTGLVRKNHLRILWAGRVVPTKLPDLVAEIGKRLDAEVFKIDVFGGESKEVKRSIFDGIASINYKGAYNGFDSIPTEKYDVLLYTALDDGLPNVILEATAAGLPIIASNDGGVGEFVQNGKTGILIKDYLNYKPYVDAIEFAIKNPDAMKKYAKNAQKLLAERHSWEKFVKTVKEDIC